MPKKGGLVAQRNVLDTGMVSIPAENWNYVTTTSTTAPATYYAASSALSTAR